MREELSGIRRRREKIIEILRNCLESAKKIILSCFALKTNKTKK